MNREVKKEGAGRRENESLSHRTRESREDEKSSDRRQSPTMQPNQEGGSHDKNINK